MFKKKVTELLDAALVERPDLFLIDFSINSDNHIKVIIDGDEGVLVEDCIFISRAIEADLDREEEDFSLEVMSAGAASPLTHNRQYKKNLNRNLKVKTSKGEVEGTLTEAAEDAITLTWKAREPKPVGKGKVTVQKEAHIPYKEIVEAKVMIKF
ncbi:ribosome assembly cofactor RimP [Tamlana haliotis]|uniref:Ribosome maturation factor RimP n=1 Tax=Pseudotamlana haliotis TaxID=2614804 RepID=A0A6N6MJD7_9FLAO|nr:ribosome assembly cofactor RimP [Tamlana haliotis]KAB1069684.1 ribosome assembly cofactor RimP [Tamlana haliotis]